MILTKVNSDNSRDKPGRQVVDVRSLDRCEIFLSRNRSKQERQSNRTGSRLEVKEVLCSARQFPDVPFREFFSTRPRVPHNNGVSSVPGRSHLALDVHRLAGNQSRIINSPVSIDWNRRKGIRGATSTIAR